MAVINNTNADIKNPRTQVAAQGLGMATDYLSGYLGNMFGDDSELGRGMGTLFSSGATSIGNTLSNNILKGTTLTEGLGVNAATSLAGSGSGLAANYIGRGINSLGGNSMLSRGIGQGVATGLGTFGGAALSNVIQGNRAFKGFTAAKDAAEAYKAAIAAGKTALEASDISKAASMASKASLWGAGMSIAGSALGAALGPSKEYGGKRGNITQTMDTAYDAIMAGVNFIPGYGLVISGAMALNKGLSNLFGSTSGMTTQDAILGSAFMPAPVKWLNMAGAKTTSTFGNLSWQNTEKANTFMGNAFGNLSDRFDKAREEAGKTYGTFSRGAYNKALDNLNFANYAWDKVLAMADLNELQNIRSLYMTSINNLRYAQMIQGGWNPIARGKQGMKIFNNATNHKVGMRLLSGAALIDNKQMILFAQSGTKMRGRMPAHPKTGSDKDPAATKDYKEWQRELDIRRKEAKKQQAEELAKKQKLQEEATTRFNQLASLILEAMNQQASEVPFTGQEYQQAAEELRLEKVEKFHEAEKVGEAALMADLAVSAAPLLLRGFKWAFNKAGLLVKVPLEKTNLFLTSPYTGKWTQFGNREYRFKPGYVGMNGVPVESRTLKITPENAADITPEQWTAAQDAAIAKGNIAEIQRLRDLHFKVNAPSTQIKDIQYHGAKGNAKFNVFDPKLIGQTDQGWAGRGYYFTPSIDYAKMYGSEPRAFYINAQKVHDGTASTYFGREDGPAAMAFKIIRKRRGNDGQQILDDLASSDAIRTSFSQTQPYNGIFEEVVTRNNNQMKLADAVTYDDKGVRIPLGERDNFKLNDIRYSWLPWFLGGSTAATLHNKSK